MLDLIWGILLIVMAAPLVVNPDIVLKRPGCKIKSAKTVRILGIVLMIAGAFTLLPVKFL